MGVERPHLQRTLPSAASRSSLRGPWLVEAAICIALAGLLPLLPAAPSYDPWAWLVWGREILHGTLSTATGPSWKPLTTLVCVPLALLGSLAPGAWLLIAHACAFGGIAGAAALAHRVGGKAAAAVTALMLLSATWYWSDLLSGFSEGALVLLVMIALQRSLEGESRMPFVLLFLAALLRPESWPFLALSGGWVVLRRPRALPWVLAGGLVVLVLWLVPEKIGSGDFFRAAAHAREYGPHVPARASVPALSVLWHCLALIPWLGRVGIGLLLAAVGWRTQRAGARPPWGISSQEARQVGAVGLAGLAWLAVEAVLVTAGASSGINRYLIMPATLLCVVGAAGWGWLLRALYHDRRRVLFGIFVLAAALGVEREVVDWGPIIDQTERNASIVQDSGPAIDLAGGVAAVRRCPPVLASYYLTPMMAWKLNAPLDAVTDTPQQFGFLFRARLYTDSPPDPPAAWSRYERLARSAHTAYWQVEVAARCA